MNAQNIKYLGVRTRWIVQRVEALAAKSDDLNLIPRTITFPKLFSNIRTRLLGKLSENTLGEQQKMMMVSVWGRNLMLTLCSDCGREVRVTPDLRLDELGF